MEVFGNTDPQAEMVVIFGNCQTPYLARLLAAADGGKSGRGYAAILNHAPPDFPLPPIPRSVLRRCKLYLEQYDYRSFVRIREEVRELVPRSCPWLVFPSYMLKALWPFRVHEPLPMIDSHHPFGRYPEGDRIGLEVIRQGLRGDEALAAYFRLSARAMPDLDKLLSQSLARTEEWDLRSDVQVGDYVVSNFRKRHIFWNFAHVSTDCIADLAKRLLMACSTDLWLDVDDAWANVQREAEMLDGMGGFQQPIHPLVAVHFGLDYADEGYIYRWFHQRWNFGAYMRNYLNRIP